MDEGVAAQFIELDGRLCSVVCTKEGASEREKAQYCEKLHRDDLAGRRPGVTSAYTYRASPRDRPSYRRLL